MLSKVNFRCSSSFGLERANPRFKIPATLEGCPAQKATVRSKKNNNGRGSRGGKYYSPHDHETPRCSGYSYTWLHKPCCNVLLNRRLRQEGLGFKRPSLTSDWLELPPSERETPCSASPLKHHTSTPRCSSASTRPRPTDLAPSVLAARGGAGMT